MKRKDFLKKTLAAGSLVAIASSAFGQTPLRSRISARSPFSPEEQIGYNHLPNKEIKTMKTVLHKAGTRGHANHGWLDTYHTFSFANYRNPERMNFGVLRVLNDDTVAAGMGFGEHPHDNMEIISIPLEGALEHRDSMGNQHVLRKGDVQVMSAGTGVRHAEFNRSKDELTKFLQIWVFPNKRNVQPRYDQITLGKEESGRWRQIVSPNPDDDGVWIHQNAYFHLGNFNAGDSMDYLLRDPENGVYFFVLDGEVKIENQLLNKRDGFGIWDSSSVSGSALSNAEVLLMEVPMSL